MAKIASRVETGWVCLVKSEEDLKGTEKGMLPSSLERPPANARVATALLNRQYQFINRSVNGFCGGMYKEGSPKFNRYLTVPDAGVS